MDITKKTLPDLVTEMKTRRDFSDKGVMAMISKSKVRHGEIKDKPKVTILLYPEIRDLISKTEPIYASSSTGANENQHTIEEEIDKVTAPYDIIEDDFLALQCEVLIEFAEDPNAPN